MLQPGCASFQKTETDSDQSVVRPGIQVPFSPVRSGGAIQWEKGPYPTLFSPESWAVWVGPEADAPTPEWAAALTLPGDRFAMLECRLKSAFADQSIAYDAVGLRGVEIWLETPDGRRILPVQIIRDGHLEESMQGALRVFGRRCLLIFPREELYFLVDRSTGAIQEMKLRIRAAQTEFTCRWSSETPVVNTPVPIQEHPAVQEIQKDVRKVWEKSKEVSHQFD